MMIVGQPNQTNLPISKSGVSQGGGGLRDRHQSRSRRRPRRPAASTSTKRIAAEAGHETEDGTGNGITGDDETSEDTGT